MDDKEREIRKRQEEQRKEQAERERERQKSNEGLQKGRPTYSRPEKDD